MPDSSESEVQKVVEVQQEIAGVSEKEANSDEFQDAVGTYKHTIKHTSIYIQHKPIYNQTHTHRYTKTPVL